jgi:hypothetical protein
LPATDKCRSDVATRVRRHRAPAFFTGQSTSSIS